MFEGVTRNGAVGVTVYECNLGEAPLARRFPAHNRIIAGLSETVVVVEGPEKSGGHFHNLPHGARQRDI